MVTGAINSNPLAPIACHRTCAVRPIPKAQYTYRALLYPAMGADVLNNALQASKKCGTLRQNFDAVANLIPWQ